MFQPRQCKVGALLNVSCRPSASLQMLLPQRRPQIVAIDTLRYFQIGRNVIKPKCVIPHLISSLIYAQKTCSENLLCMSMSK